MSTHKSESASVSSTSALSQVRSEPCTHFITIFPHEQWAVTDQSAALLPAVTATGQARSVWRELTFPQRDCLRKAVHSYPAQLSEDILYGPTLRILLDKGLLERRPTVTGQASRYGAKMNPYSPFFWEFFATSAGRDVVAAAANGGEPPTPPDDPEKPRGGGNGGNGDGSKGGQGGFSPLPATIAITLSAEEEAMLTGAARVRKLADEADTDGWYFPVAQELRPVADNLVLAGYLTRHPNSRRFWYACTDEGQRRASFVLGEFGGPATKETPIEKMRRDNLERLMGDMAQEGYLPLPEPGRTTRLGQQAFFRIGDGRKRLFFCRINSVRWLENDRYYKPFERAAIAAAVAALPF